MIQNSLFDIHYSLRVNPVLIRVQKKTNIFIEPTVVLLIISRTPIIISRSLFKLHRWHLCHHQYLVVKN